MHMEVKIKNAARTQGADSDGVLLILKKHFAHVVNYHLHQIINFTVIHCTFFCFH